ncbi:MAG: hypothetical protein KAW12_22270 [Candidatus Aminicenantes bacterium]|nr:hypothetical protein [Candidatus Aminicenantes bacterium]
MEAAVERFFPDHKNWDLSAYRKDQAENIQVIADGPRMNTSLTIYDDGEGQHPEDFESTFLSLLKGNKNDIHFVQGKYNMGGSGATVFCGKKRYQLVASKRYDGTGKFGFTLMRRHPFSDEEKKIKKNTWYEYLKLDKKIPSFEIVALDLGLYNRSFAHGTIIKLYSYDLPAGSRSVISRDLNQSLNEYLFEPALPLFTIDQKERYPDDKNLERDLYGLKRRLEEDSSRYVEDYFVEEYSNKEIGKVKITCYIFKTKIAGKNIRESKESIRREFFKNNMSVLFSLNGQVHGHYTSEFITRALKYQLLKDFLLIHVDCTRINYDFRTELFMASRDRLKDGKESKELRRIVAETLRKGKLDEINKRRRASITIGSGDTRDLFKSFTKNLPLKSDLLKLLNQTFKLEERQEKKKKNGQQKQEKIKKEKRPFNPKRFPSYFKLNPHEVDGKPIARIPIGGEKAIKFLSDVENQYFVRVEEPGELEMALVGYKPVESAGRNNSGVGEGEVTAENIEDVFNVVTKSPNDGTIKVTFNPTEKVKVGDWVQIKTTLTNPGQDFDQIFWVKISEPEQPKTHVRKEREVEDDKIGLPQYHLVYKEAEKPGDEEERMTWEKFGEHVGEQMEYNSIVYPLAEGDTLTDIYINMDSTVLKNYKSGLKSEVQFDAAEKRYITTVYFHTLFLYTISKNRKYSIKQTVDGQDQDKDIVDYIKDIFENYYSQFLLNFEMGALIDSLDG